MVFFSSSVRVPAGMGARGARGAALPGPSGMAGFGRLGRGPPRGPVARRELGEEEERDGTEGGPFRQLGADHGPVYTAARPDRPRGARTLGRRTGRITSLPRIL